MALRGAASCWIEDDVDTRISVDQLNTAISTRLFEEASWIAVLMGGQNCKKGGSGFSPISSLLDPYNIQYKYYRIYRIPIQCWY